MHVVPGPRAQISQTRTSASHPWRTVRFGPIADVPSLAQGLTTVAWSVGMAPTNERRARKLLRVSMLTGSVLSAIALASAFHWLTIGRGQNLALGIGLAMAGLCGWLSSRWLRKRQLPL
jgi:hypothetical protein